MGVRRSVFEEVSGFAPMRFGEDMDLSMRILESGHSSALIDDASSIISEGLLFVAFTDRCFIQAARVLI